MHEGTSVMNGYIRTQAKNLCSVLALQEYALRNERGDRIYKNVDEECLQNSCPAECEVLMSSSKGTDDLQLLTGVAAVPQWISQLERNSPAWPRKADEVWSRMGYCAVEPVSTCHAAQPCLSSEVGWTTQG